MSKSLQMSLKTKWFEMTKAGIKTEDYREITPYWCKRLLSYFKDKQGSISDGKQLLFFIPNEDTPIFNNFDFNIMTLGYPKSTDTERILKFEHNGIEIGYGKEEWGAEPNKLYFIIKHGSIIND